MLKSSKTILILLLILTLSPLVKAVEVASCLSCSPLMMLNLAKNSLDFGSILVYNPIDRATSKYMVTTETEAGFTIKSAFPVSMSSGENEFALAMYDLYEKIGEGNSIVVSIGMEGYPSYNGSNVYDIYYNSRIRNNLSDLIRDQINGMINNDQAAMAMLTAITNALNNIVSVDLSLTFLINFDDGSTAVFDLSVQNGMYPEHNPADSRNRDGNNNQILSSETNSSPNTYGFSNGNQANDFVDAANANNVVIIGFSSGSSGGTMKCSLIAGNILKCVYIPHPK